MFKYAVNSEKETYFATDYSVVLKMWSVRIHIKCLKYVKEEKLCKISLKVQINYCVLLTYKNLIF